MLLTAVWLGPVDRALPQVVLPPGLGGMPVGQTVPSQGYDVALAALAAGDFSGALEIASREYQGGMRAGAQRWIDSIANAAVVGEAQFELGRFREAIAAYDEALLLAATHSDWLLAVQFPMQPLRPLPQRRVATWGRSQRDTSPAAIPDTLSIRLGAADPQEVLKKGGVLTAPVNYPVRPQEIVKSLVIALYRRADILGDLSREGTALDEATKSLIRRPAPPNHYSQSWVDIALGTAYWSQGKSDQAVPLLNRGLLAGNKLDHPLTPWGLIVLGRIALDSDQPAAAAKLFEEATYIAADYGDARALEEAFRLAFAAHMAAGVRGPPPSIAAAAAWSRGTLPSLRARLLAMQAEALAASGNAKVAAESLAEIDGRLLRGEFGRGWCGAQAAYAAAVTGYASGDVAAADAELDRALKIAQSRCQRLFQTARLVELVLAGSTAISDRQADALFAKQLGDPAARDFATDPLGTLAAISTPRSEAFDTWINAASRRGNDAVLAAAEARLRGKWLASRPLGGRRDAVATLIGSDPDTLPREPAARRAALLARHPELARVLDESMRVRGPLTANLLARPGDGADGPPDWKNYAKLADRCGRMIAAVAAGRDPTVFDFPPLTPGPEIRRRLPAKHLILSFHWTGSVLFGALESNARVATWQVRNPAALAKEIAAVSKAIGLVDPVSPVSTERLLETDWRPAVERVERLLFENSKIAFNEGVEELVIVPDGLLWYLPFELLPVGSARNVAADDPAAESDGGSDRRMLRDACRIRYSPTRSLAVMQFETPRPGGPLGIHAGRIFRGDRLEAGQEVIARFSAAFENVFAFSDGNPPALTGSLCDTLVVLDELAGEGPISSRPLIAAPTPKGGMTFGDWLSPPHKRPSRVVLAGLQTEMAGGLAKASPRAGDDLFLAATDLLAAGARTAVLSRWRTGGKVSVDLVEEFVRDATVKAEENAAELVASRAAESWHRAVDVVTSEQPDLTREPRVRQSPEAVLADAKHPFFWSGYAVIDCGIGRHAEPAQAAAPQPQPVKQAGP